MMRRKLFRKRIVSVLGLAACLTMIAAPSKAYYHATAIEKPRVVSNGGGGYVGQVYAKNTRYKKTNENESWFRACMSNNKYDTEPVQRSAKKYFQGKETAYAISPSASWRYNECSAYME